MRKLVLALLAIGLASCAAWQGHTPAQKSLSQVELKYRLLAQVGPIAYCDPDLYPIARVHGAAYVQQRLTDIKAKEPQTYLDILDHYGFREPLSESQQAQVYADYKKLAALRMTPSGDRYSFEYFVDKGGNRGDLLTNGSIDKSGSIKVDSQTPSMFACPICLSADTLIETPNGRIPVVQIKVGTVVWTVDAHGRRVARAVLKVRSMAGGPGFLVRLQLADGRELWVSPRHPLADGRLVGDLVVGDFVDGSRVMSSELQPSEASTYDLLPSGPTGFYWANGILIGSTL
jgi:hypothetical protein